MSEKQLDIGELRAKFRVMTISQKREFLTKLKLNLTKISDPDNKYRDFYHDCVDSYNASISNLNR